MNRLTSRQSHRRHPSRLIFDVSPKHPPLFMSINTSNIRFVPTALFAIALAVFSGCATTNDVIRVKESGSEGTAQGLPVTVGQAWDIAKTVFRWEGADAIEEHKSENYMLTSSGPNLVPSGAVMGAWVERVDDANTKVTVVTKRRISVNVATTLTESKFQKRFAQAVEIVKKGQTLPRIAP